jgi:outer membrane immunogenic protein
MDSAMKKYLSAATMLAVLAVSFHGARAALPGDGCSTVGMEQVSSDQRQMLACLSTGNGYPVWVSLTSAPAQGQYGQRQPGPGAVYPGAQSGPANTQPSDRRAQWRGWYLGAAMGYAGTADSFGDVSTDVGGNTSEEGLTTTGLTAGIVGGYNVITNSDLFYGFEGDINTMSNAQHLAYNDSVTGDLAQEKAAWSGYGTMRGRLGFALDPGLLFITGGLAIADIERSYTFPGSAPVVTGFSEQGLSVGWTAGAGAEFAVTQKISISTEYLRVQLPETSNLQSQDDGAPLKFHLQNSADILRAAANWHFN